MSNKSEKHSVYTLQMFPALQLGKSPLLIVDEIHKKWSSMAVKLTVDYCHEFNLKNNLDISKDILKEITKRMLVAIEKQSNKHFSKIDEMVIRSLNQDLLVLQSANIDQLLKLIDRFSNVREDLAKNIWEFEDLNARLSIVRKRLSKTP